MRWLPQPYESFLPRTFLRNPALRPWDERPSRPVSHKKDEYDPQAMPQPHPIPAQMTDAVPEANGCNQPQKCPSSADVCPNHAQSHTAQANADTSPPIPPPYPPTSHPYQKYTPRKGVFGGWVGMRAWGYYLMLERMSFKTDQTIALKV